MHKVRIFLNKHASGSEDTDRLMGAISRRLFRSELEFYSPATLEDLQTELRRAVDDRVDVVVSVGGDGTVNTLIQHLGGSETAFLILPAGTANDLARELGFLGKVDKAVLNIRNNQPERIDLIRINQKIMATNGGLGLASEVATKVNNLRKQFPAFKNLMHLMHERIYSVMLGLELIGPQLNYFELELESEEFTGRVTTPLLMVNNQPALGGKFRIAPRTINDDGRFNVSAFTHTSRRNFSLALAKVRLQGAPPPGQDPEFISFETKRLRIRTYRPLLFYGDGESLEFANDFDIECMPQALKVYGYRSLRERTEKAIIA